MIGSTESVTSVVRSGRVIMACSVA
jgi:hypothetical protein